MALNQQFCLRWNNHQSTLISVFDHLLESGTLVDCTLAAEGQFLKAHKVVLSACSPYLEALLSQHYEKHPILILKDVSFHELKSMLDYMYRGEVNISQEQLGTFLKAAESLQIKGLTDCGAMSETRDLERSREVEHGRIPGEFSRIDRSLGSALSKRIDVRKQIPIQPRPRSPLVGLPANFVMNADHRRVNKHPLTQDGSLATSNVIRNREGSLSPTIKRKRPISYVSQNEDPSVPPPVENNVDQNHQQKSEKIQNSSPVPQSLSNSVPVSTNASETKKQSESENLVDSEVIKREVKMENVEFTDEVQNDDSVEDLTVDEEEEEMDEMDLSQPGPSTATNSLVAGVPWHTAGEGNSDDGLLASQHDSQGVSNSQANEGKMDTKESSNETEILRRKSVVDKSKQVTVCGVVKAVPNLFEDLDEKNRCNSCGVTASDGYFNHEPFCAEVILVGGKRCECLCGASFVSEVFVKKHMMHFCHRNPELKSRMKVKCENCSSIFASNRSLKVHSYRCRGKFHVGPTKGEIYLKKDVSIGEKLNVVLENKLKGNRPGCKNVETDVDKNMNISRTPLASQSHHLSFSNVNTSVRTNDDSDSATRVVKVTSNMPLITPRVISNETSPTNTKGSKTKLAVMNSNESIRQNKQKELFKTLELMPVAAECSSKSLQKDPRIRANSRGYKRLQDSTAVSDSSCQRLQEATLLTSGGISSGEEVKTVFNDLVKELKAERRKLKEEINSSDSASDSETPIIEQDTSQLCYNRVEAESTAIVKFACICGEMFSKKNSLVQHQKVCEKNNRYRCEFCPYFSLDLAGLRNHVILDHKDIIKQHISQNN